MADVTIVDDTLEEEVQAALAKRLAHVQPAPRTIYPLHYACPSAVGRIGETNTGATEIMAPWADAVS
ncbi:MAG: hypothetical protein WBB25_09660 [Sulfitobacter sp.]